MTLSNLKKKISIGQEVTLQIAHTCIKGEHSDYSTCDYIVYEIQKRFILLRMKDDHRTCHRLTNKDLRTEFIRVTLKQ